MKKLFFVAFMALLGMAVPANANGVPPFKVESGANFYFRITGPYGSGTQTQLGPWYQYWPLEAHFQTPAMPQYPYWPSPMGLPPRAAYAIPGAPYGAPYAAPVAPAAPLPPPAQVKPLPAPVPTPVPTPVKPMNYQIYSRPVIQPVGYYGAPPAYWYGR